MNRPTVIPSFVVAALVLSACASERIAAPATSVAIAPVPADIGEAVDLAKSQRGAGNLDGATATLSQLVLIAPDDPRVLGEYGKILVDRGESLDALAFLQRAIELSPGEWSFYSAQGVAFAQRGDFRSAQMAFVRALTLKPNDPVILNNFALAHLQAGNLDQAEALLLRAASSGDLHPKVAQNLALVRQMRGEARPEAPATQVASTAVPPAPPNETLESGAATPVDDLRTPDSQASLAVADIEAVETLELVAETVEEQIASPESDALVIDHAADVEEAAQDVSATAEEPIIENEMIETVALAVVKTANDSAQEIVALPQSPAAESELAGAATQDEEEGAAETLEADIWIPSTGPIYLQVGSFASEENAERAIERLDSFEAIIAIAEVSERTLYRVVVGPYADRNETHLGLGALKEFGIDDVQVLTRLPGTAHRRDEIADEAPSGAPADDLASENSDEPEHSPSLSYAESL